MKLLHGAAVVSAMFWLVMAMYYALTDKVMAATPAAPMSASTAVVMLITFGLMGASAALALDRECGN